MGSAAEIGKSALLVNGIVVGKLVDQFQFIRLIGEELSGLVFGDFGADERFVGLDDLGHLCFENRRSSGVRLRGRSKS